MKSVEDIADKMERIVKVIYMATDHLSYRNEIRNNIRNSSLSVMAGVIDTVSNNGYDTQRDLQASIYKTMSYIKIAMSDKSMSDVNGQLLLSAYSKLLSFINNIYISDNTTDNRNITDNIRDIQYTDTIGHDHHDREHTQLYRNRKSNPIHNTNSGLSPTLPTREGANTNSKSERREKILNIIKSKSDTLNTNKYNVNNIDNTINTGCSMSDLLSDLKDMNEKMIQRELTAMVIDQLIVKKGEKRWSRYVTT